MENGESQTTKGSAFARGDTDEEKVTRFVAGGVVSIGAFVAGGVFQIAWFVLTQRFLGPEDYGVFGPIIGVFWGGCALVSLGVPQTITTFVSHHFEKEPEMSKRFVGDGVKLLLLLGAGLLVAVGLGGGLMYLLGALSGFNYAVGVVLAVSIAVTIAFWGVSSTLNGYQRLDLVAVGNLIFPVCMFAGAMFFMLGAQRLFGAESRWDVAGATLGFFVAHLFGFFFAAAMLRRMGAVPLREIFSLGNYHGLFRKILKFGGMSAVAIVAMNVLSNSGTPIVGALANLGWFGETQAANDVQSGYFSTAYMYAMVMMLTMGFSIALMPAISDAEGQGRRDLMQKYYNLALKYSFGLQLSIFTLYAVMIGRLIALASGPEYPPPVLGPVAVALSTGTICITTIFMMTFMFIGLKRPLVPAAVNLIVVAVQAGGIVVFCWAGRGVMWAAWGILLGSGLGVAALFWFAWRRFGLGFPAWTLAIPAAASLPTYLIGYHFLPKEGPLTGFTIAALFVMHAVFFLLFGGYDADDFVMFRETASSMRMGFVKSVINGMEKLARSSPAFEWYKK